MSLSLDPRCPLHSVIYVYSEISVSKLYLGSKGAEGGESTKKLQIPNDKRQIANLKNKKTTSGQFENLMFVIMSIKENVRHIS